MTNFEEHLFTASTSPSKHGMLKKKEILHFLKLANNPERLPILIHCKHGADRTGLFCAVYRVAFQGWSKEAAIREMTTGGYGFHSIWQNLPTYLRNLDIEALKLEARILSPSK